MHCVTLVHPKVSGPASIKSTSSTFWQNRQLVLHKFAAWLLTWAPSNSWTQSTLVKVFVVNVEVDESVLVAGVVVCGEVVVMLVNVLVAVVDGRSQVEYEMHPAVLGPYATISAVVPLQTRHPIPSGGSLQL